MNLHNINPQEIVIEPKKGKIITGAKTFYRRLVAASLATFITLTPIMTDAQKVYANNSDPYATSNQWNK